MADDTREKDSSSATAAAPFAATADAPKKLPKGVILGKDGKP